MNWVELFIGEPSQAALRRNGLSTPPDLENWDSVQVYHIDLASQLRNAVQLPRDPLPERWQKLISAAERDDVDEVKVAVENEWLPNSEMDRLINNRLEDILYDAISAGSTSVATYLLLRENIFWNSFYAGKAVSKGLLPVMAIFLNRGWDLNKSQNPMVPPVLAQALDSRSTCEWLLAHGANPNAQCKLGWTPLTQAIRTAPRDIIELLFEHGGSTEHGELLHAVLHRKGSDWQEIFQLLLDRGGDINRIEYHNKEFCFDHHNFFGPLGTPLYEAAQTGRADAVRFLLDHGADPNIRSSWNYLAVDRAWENNHHEVVELLHPFYQPYQGEPMWVGMPKYLMRKIPFPEDTWWQHGREIRQEFNAADLCQDF